MLRSPPPPSHHGLSLDQRGKNIRTGHNVQASVLVEEATSSEDLALLHLDAPITAVHTMTLGGMPPSPSSIRSQETGPPSSFPMCSDGQGGNSLVFPTYDDVISAGIITESEGRKLFQL